MCSLQAETSFKVVQTFCCIMIYCRTVVTRPPPGDLPPFRAFSIPRITQSSICSGQSSTSEEVKDAAGVVLVLVVLRDDGSAGSGLVTSAVEGVFDFCLVENEIENDQ